LVLGSNPSRPSNANGHAPKPMKSLYECKGKLWKYPGAKANWYFITLPVKLSQEISLVDAGPRRRGFGSLRVQASIGQTTWETSIFPSASADAYLLPVKAQVRKREALKVGVPVALRLEVSRLA
jgi:hypothetical protein